MAARKYSASMDEDLLDEVQQAAADAGLTVSAFLAEAAAERIALLGLQRLAADYEAEHGAFTEEELREAHARLDAAGVVDHRARRRLDDGDPADSGVDSPAVRDQPIAAADTGGGATVHDESPRRSATG